MKIVKEYEAKLDNKKRLTIRGAKYNHYKVRELSDGKIELSPQVLIETDELSEKSLRMIETSVVNFKMGKVSEPIDLSKFENEE
ncbi:MAG: hypothetical protein U5R06_23430 [candidate division KSB1 bacterium]|nr:hypothetical protein [candidate division KSB1 bacterium]